MIATIVLPQSDYLYQLKSGLEHLGRRAGTSCACRGGEPRPLQPLRDGPPNVARLHVGGRLAGGEAASTGEGLSSGVLRSAERERDPCLSHLCVGARPLSVLGVLLFSN